MKSSVKINLDSALVITDKSFTDGEFSSMLKVTEMFPVYQKKDHLDKESCIHVSALSQCPKYLINRLLYKQTEEFMKIKLPPLLTGFRENHITQQSPLSLMRENKLITVNRYVCFYGFIKSI